MPTRALFTKLGQQVVCEIFRVTWQTPNVP